MVTDRSFGGKKYSNNVLDHIGYYDIKRLDGNVLILKVTLYFPAGFKEAGLRIQLYFLFLRSITSENLRNCFHCTLKDRPIIGFWRH